MTVALDVRPEDTYKWIDAAAPTHPSLIDTTHATGELFGFSNIPMAVWIDEDGVIVRPAESASIERSALKDMDLSDAIPEPIRNVLSEAKNIPDDSAAYRAAIVDWTENGAQSRYALSPDEVIALSQPRGADEARAAACFELGEHLRRTVGPDAGVAWWREAHRLFPSNWTYKRQAWTLVTTPNGAPDNDLMQGPNDVYEGSWYRDVVASGGGQAYTVRPQL